MAPRLHDETWNGHRVGRGHMFPFVSPRKCKLRNYKRTFLRLHPTLDLQLAYLFPISYGRPCPSSPLFPVYMAISCMGNTNLFGNTYAHRVFLHLLLTCLLGASSSSGTLYCRVQHPACDVVLISYLADYETQSGLICICGMERYIINYTS